MEVACENCRFEKTCMFHKRYNGKVIDCTDFKPKTEAQKFVEKMEEDAQTYTNRLYGDITNGYTYCNPDFIKSDKSLPKFPLVEKFCHIHQLKFEVEAISSRCGAYKLSIRNIWRPFKEMTQTVVIRDGREVSTKLENEMIKKIYEVFMLKERSDMPTRNYSSYSERGNKPLFEIDNGPRYRIKDVIFNDPATIVLWADGTKTVVKCNGEQVFDPEKGLAMAIVKKYMGTNKSKSNYCDIFKKWIPEVKEEVKKEEVKEESKKSSYDGVKLMTVKEFAKRAGVSESTIRSQISKGQFPKAFKDNGKWMIPVEK